MKCNLFSSLLCKTGEGPKTSAQTGNKIGFGVVYGRVGSDTLLSLNPTGNIAVPINSHSYMDNYSYFLALIEIY